jgi:carbon monoxide dehydrogenase subunit G
VKVKLERTFPIPAAPEVTWGVLADIETVAGCMPGAKITEKLDDTHYKGTVSVKLGPANLSFRGEITVQELTAETRTLRLSAKGTDTSGTSVASMDLMARVEAADGGASALVGHSEASVGGKAAAFGGRMMDAVSDQILKQFAANFTARVAAQAAVPAAAAGPADSRGGSAGEAATTSAAAAPGSAAGVVMPPPPPQQLNGLALLWAILRDWLRGLFSKKTA